MSLNEPEPDIVIKSDNPYKLRDEFRGKQLYSIRLLMDATTARVYRWHDDVILGSDSLTVPPEQRLRDLIESVLDGRLLPEV